MEGRGEGFGRLVSEPHVDVTGRSPSLRVSTSTASGSPRALSGHYIAPARGEIATSTTCFSPDIRARRPRPDRLLRRESRHLRCQRLAGSAARTRLGALVPNWLLNCAVGGPRVVDGGQMVRDRLPNFVNRNETLPRARRDLNAACDRFRSGNFAYILRDGRSRAPPPRLAKPWLEIVSVPHSRV